MLSKKAQKRQRKRDRKLLEMQSDDDEVVHVIAPNKVNDEEISFKKRKGSEKEGQWNFEVEYNDHFETPKIAYADLLPVLQQVASDKKKQLSELVVYDPYYCEGQMITFLNELGVKNVINRNRDFYEDIKEQNIPDYDILVTNPPYSGEHKQKLLDYLLEDSTPFCLLLPAYVAAKSYWREFVEAIKKRNNSEMRKVESQEVKLNEIYLLPPENYEYKHPEGTGKDVAPFYSCWFIGGKFKSMLAVRRSILSPAHNTNRCLSVSVSIENLIRRGAISADSVKRPNPRNRKKKKEKIMLDNKP